MEHGFKHARDASSHGLYRSKGSKGYVECSHNKGATKIAEVAEQSIPSIPKDKVPL
jgi:hypothetical protein